MMLRQHRSGARQVRLASTAAVAATSLALVLSFALLRVSGTVGARQDDDGASDSSSAADDAGPMVPFAFEPKVDPKANGTRKRKPPPRDLYPSDVEGFSDYGRYGYLRDRGVWPWIVIMHPYRRRLSRANPDQMLAGLGVRIHDRFMLCDIYSDLRTRNDFPDPSEYIPRWKITINDEGHQERSRAERRLERQFLARLGGNISLFAILDPFARGKSWPVFNSRVSGMRQHRPGDWKNLAWNQTSYLIWRPDAPRPKNVSDIILSGVFVNATTETQDSRLWLIEDAKEDKLFDIIRPLIDFPEMMVANFHATSPAIKQPEQDQTLAQSFGYCQLHSYMANTTLGPKREFGYVPVVCEHLARRSSLPRDLVECEIHPQMGWEAALVGNWAHVGAPIMCGYPFALTYIVVHPSHLENYSSQQYVRRNLVALRLWDHRDLLLDDKTYSLESARKLVG